MSGTLPENFGAGLRSLREIELHNSCFGDPVTFTGTIPSSFFVGMENLQTFDVYCASLEGKKDFCIFEVHCEIYMLT